MALCNHLLLSQGSAIPRIKKKQISTQNNFRNLGALQSIFTNKLYRKVIEEVLKKKFVGDITIVLKNMSNKEEILEKKFKSFHL